MDCAFCEEPMERQDGYARGSMGQIVNKSAIYACMTCGREYMWELGVTGLRPLFAPEDFDPPEPPYAAEDADGEHSHYPGL